MSKAPVNIEIQTEFIRLDAFLKFASAVGTGGEAKVIIQGGGVSVNGETCTQRTKKLRSGDTVTYNGESFAVSGGAG